ncbi:hypothetical protein BGZ46_007301 [Entomortierella lignicola]|nr:hypothetical protein BGZ46_007301 [Entomortierella lignicola]
MTPTQNNEHYDDSVEAMDVDDEVQLLSITSTITNFRQHATTVEAVAISPWASGPATSRPSDDSDPDAVVIFDTNVLISHLNFLQSFVQAYGKKSAMPNQPGKWEPYIIFVVPWVVVQELDGLKSGRGGGSEIDLRGKAQRAIRYLQDELGRPEGTRKLRGQKISEHMEKQQKNDDSILDCCRYFRHIYGNEKNTKVALFSNDRNLCVKALIHEIKTISRNNIAFEPRAVYAAILEVDQADLMEEDDMMLDGNVDLNSDQSSFVRKTRSSNLKNSRSYYANYRTEVNDREIQRIKTTSKVASAPEDMDPLLFDLTNHVIKNLRRYFEFAIPDHLKAYYGSEWRSITNFEESRVKEEDQAYDCRRLSQPFLLLQRYWRTVFSNLYGSPDKSDSIRSRLDSVQSFVKNWDRVQTFGLGKVYKKDLTIFLNDVEDLLSGITTKPVIRKNSTSATEQGTDALMDDASCSGYYDAPSRIRLIKDWKDHCKALHG